MHYEDMTAKGEGTTVLLGVMEAVCQYWCASHASSRDVLRAWGKKIADRFYQDNLDVVTGSGDVAQIGRAHV